MRLGKIPTYLYHATFTSLLESIMATGLGSTVPFKNWNDSRDGVVYLADDPEVAVSYVESSEVAPEDWLAQIVVLQVKTDSLDLSLLHHDSNVIDDNATYEYHGIIPSNVLNVV